MIEVAAPQIGERIYDGACGSAGFLCGGFGYLSAKATTTEHLATPQTRSFYGKEKKRLAYVIEKSRLAPMRSEESSSLYGSWFDLVDIDRQRNCRQR
ncbi:N-6 DNA methylase [Roseateles sp.]|uniref:N-6 DNA methylase n=1 Tax=Roseateles sp. TaxID=1971397 RepID=UPI00286CCC3A|nr:N-6 DNA methylase [Roseateles sp.]